MAFGFKPAVERLEDRDIFNLDFVKREDDPYCLNLNDAVELVMGNMHFSGIYIGMTKEGMLVLSPWLRYEHSNLVDRDKPRDQCVFEIKRPLLLDSRNFVVVPTRRKYLESLLAKMSDPELDYSI